MTQTYEELANAILKKRKKNTDKHNRVQPEQIKADFIAFALRLYFKNIIDLIIEANSLIVDPTDHEFILEELFKLEDMSIKTLQNSANKTDRIITFKEIFGLTIQFVSTEGSPNFFHCNISGGGKIIISTTTDLDRITLATYVADYLEKNS